MFSLESPHRGDSNKYTQYTIFNIRKKIPEIIQNLQLCDLVQGTQEQVRNSRGRRAISVRATEGLLYFPSFASISYGRWVGGGLKEIIRSPLRRFFLLKGDLISEGLFCLGKQTNMKS